MRVTNTKSYRFNFISFAILLLTVTVFSNCVYGQDLSTDEKVLKVLNKGRDNILEKQDVCIERPASLKGIIIVGFFAHDRGCGFDSAFVNGKRYEDEKAATKAGLIFLGWNKIKTEECGELALNWTKNALLKFSHPLSKATTDFNQPNTPQFIEPQSKIEDDKSVKVTLWVQQPAGMQPITYYDLQEYTFTSDGNLKEVKTIKSFNISSTGY